MSSELVEKCHLFLDTAEARLTEIRKLSQQIEAQIKELESLQDRADTLAAEEETIQDSCECVKALLVTLTSLDHQQ